MNRGWPRPRKDECEAAADPARPPGQEGARLDRVRLNEIVSYAAFGGRRRRVYARITALSGARRGDRVWDIGCGGYLARMLSAAGGPGGQVTAIDPSAAAVRYAQRRAPDNRTVDLLLTICNSSGSLP